MRKLFQKIFKFIIVCLFILPFPINQKISHAGYQDNRLWIVSFQETFRLNLEKGYLFFLTFRCQYCQQIEEEIVSWALNTIDQVYFVVLDKSTRFCQGNLNDITFEITTNFCIWGTPSLYFICENKIVHKFIGVSQIVGFLKDEV